MFRTLLTISLIITGVVTCFAQDLVINNIEFSENLVKIKYEVEDTVSGRMYTVRAYSSHDNFLNPLEKVSGDIGYEILPGGERIMKWDATAELGNEFDGNVSIELRAKVYVPFLTMEWFDDVKTIKRKQEYDITWAGGRSGNVLNFDLYNRHGEKVATFPNIANVGHFTLIIPSDIKPGRGYRFKIRDSRNGDEVVFTGRFRVKRKTPLFISLLVPAVAVSSGVYGATKLFEGSDDPADIEDPILPSN